MGPKCWGKFAHKGVVRENCFVRGGLISSVINGLGPSDGASVIPHSLVALSDQANCAAVPLIDVSNKATASNKALARSCVKYILAGLCFPFPSFEKLRFHDGTILYLFNYFGCPFERRLWTSRTRNDNICRASEYELYGNTRTNNIRSNADRYFVCA